MICKKEGRKKLAIRRCKFAQFIVTTKELGTSTDAAVEGCRESRRRPQKPSRSSEGSNQKFSLKRGAGAHCRARCHYRKVMFVVDLLNALSWSAPPQLATAVIHPAGGIHRVDE